jgi:holo-[acyl-carrier protein] synthase
MAGHAMSSRVPCSVGVDVVAVADVAAAVSRFGERYVRRVFTAEEAAYCQAAAPPVAAARLAARFAAKEAAVKALDPDERWTAWRDIEVHRGRTGRCTLRLHGDAGRLAERRGIDRLLLSMSHEADVAAAVVVALPSTSGHGRS